MTVYNEKFFRSWLSRFGKEYAFTDYLDKIKFNVQLQDEERGDTYRVKDFYPIAINRKADIFDYYPFTVEKRNGSISIIL